MVHKGSTCYSQKELEAEHLGSHSQVHARVQLNAFVGAAWLGTARPGAARLGKARHGEARYSGRDHFLFRFCFFQRAFAALRSSSFDACASSISGAILLATGSSLFSLSEYQLQKRARASPERSRAVSVEVPTPGSPIRVHFLTRQSVHTIRESLQIILDFAERASNESVIKQVHRIEEEISAV